MTAAVETTEPGVHFGLVELDLLAAHAGVPFPFPLRVPTFGRIPGERDVLLNTAGQALRWRGLADEQGPAGAAAGLVTALREHRSTVDLVLTSPDGTLGVVAMVYRSWALLCHQRLDGDPTSTVRIRRIAETALTRELLALIPDLAPARSIPITLPAKVLEADVDDVEDDAERQRRLRAVVRDHGGDPAVLDRLAALLAALTGRGQLGATTRSRGVLTRTGPELSWLDSPQGRVRITRTDNGWVSVNPLRQADLRSALEGLASLARTR